MCSPVSQATAVCAGRGESAAPPKFKLTTNPPAKEQAALIKTGDATDGALKGKRFVLMETSDTTQSKLRFVHYSGSRQAKVIKAKKTSPYNHSVHGLMIKSALPSLKK